MLSWRVITLKIMWLKNFLAEYSNLPTSLQVLILAFAILGILFGIIFVIDGWKSVQQPTLTRRGAGQDFNILRSSPKFLGLTYVIGAGVLPTLTDLIRVFGFKSETAPGLAMATYSLFVAISALISIFIFSIYAFGVALGKIHRIEPNASLWLKILQALPLFSVALQKGNEAFLEEIDYISMVQELALTLRGQRDASTAFLTGVFDRLVKNNIRDIRGVEAFVDFLRSYLKVFIEQFFDFDTGSNKYRASIYFLSDSNSLVFVCGHGHWSCPHSMQPLSLDKSLAGYATKNPGYIHIYTENSKVRESLPFQTRSNKVRYKTVITCAIQPLRPKQDNLPSRMVLCIDSIDHEVEIFKMHKEFITRITLFFAVIISTAQASMKVSDDELNAFLRKS